MQGHVILHSIPFSGARPHVHGACSHIHTPLASLPRPKKSTQADGTALTQTAHYYMECSNKGLCDRTTATCACFTGYEGHSCQRASCPNDCSGHGVCKTNRELAAGDYGNIYELWDADMVSCQFGWLSYSLCIQVAYQVHVVLSPVSSNRFLRGAFLEIFANWNLNLKTSLSSQSNADILFV